jgi:hypothetical protein
MMDGPMLSPDVERKLDALLAGWAERHSLSPVRAEAIQRQALATAEGELSREWWLGFLKGLNTTLRRSLSTWQPGVSAAVALAQGSR